MASNKPCRIELNNSGAWKLLGKFDADAGEAADEIMNAAARLVDALNDKASGRPGLVTLRVTDDDPHPNVLMRYHSSDKGWEHVKVCAP